MGTPRGRKSKRTTFNFNSPRDQNPSTSENPESLGSKTKLIPKKLDMDAYGMSASNESLVSNIHKKISIIQNDITKVKCDAIVNAANVTLLGGGGIDGVIHKMAGPQLLNKCRGISIKEKRNNVDIRCYPGECEVTDVKGSNLSNCKFVFHTVGPDLRQNSDMSYNTSILKSCYANCLEKVHKHNVHTIAFSCISTGIYGYPSKEAAVVALDSVIAWLQANNNSIEKIIFCTYLPIDFKIYNELFEQRFAENSVKTSVENEPDFSISREDIPTKLHNSNNVCFANSTIQILYALSTFRTYILSTSLDNVVIHGLRKVFTMIINAKQTTENRIVANDTFNIVKDLDIPEYHDNDHFDVVEFLRYVLDNSFPKDNMNLTIHSLFKMYVNSSIVCNSCQKDSTTSYVTPIFDLPIEMSYEHQSIGALLDRYFDERGYPRADYRCEREVKENEITGCDKIGTCNQSIQMTDIGEYVIISLRIYH
jgi:O-acetyl-ADP-ribose deacetylase (regulator of RNase III)